MEHNHQPLPPIKVAFVLDGEVIDILHTDERLGAIFLSQPIILDVTEEPLAMVGAFYDETTGAFTPPVDLK